MNDGESSPAEFFGVVSNSTRVEILQALASVYSDSPTDPWLAYSDLYDAVAVRDKGNFNYHLDQLDDLVVKRPVGYRISRIGMDIISTVASGSYDSDWTWGPVDVPGECPFCADSVRLRYEDGNLHLTCGTDEHSLPLSVPPSLLDSHPRETVIEQVAFMTYNHVALTCQGICSECQGYVDGKIDTGGVQPEHYHYHGTCRRCGFHHGIPVGMFVLPHPDVLTFFCERGTDVRSTPFWTLDFCNPGAETVLSKDSLRLRVDVRQDDETLSLTLDREGTVISTDRSCNA